MTSSTLRFTNGWRITTAENKFSIFKNDNEVFVLTGNDPIVGEFEVLATLKEHQKLRRVDGKICVETRSVFARTLSNDSRELVYEDLRRLASSTNTDEQVAALKHAIKLLCTTSYKKDTKWTQKASLLLKQIRVNETSNKTAVVNNKVETIEDLKEAAIRDNVTDLVKYLQFSGDKTIGSVFNWASIRGRLDIVKYLHSLGTKCTEFAMDFASENGHLEVVKFLHEVVGAGCTVDAMDFASENGHLEVVKFLHEVVGAGCTVDAMNWASINGHLEIVKYLHSLGTKCTEFAMDWASEHGHLEVVKYLHEVVGVGCTKYAIDSAILKGHLEIVKYLHEVVGAECSQWAMNWAISCSHLEVVKYLHEVVGLPK